MGGVAVLTFLPGLISGSEGIERVSEVLAAGGNPPRLVLDLSHLRVVSSTFLAMLVKLHRNIAAAGGTMALYGMSPVGRDALRATRLDQMLRVFDDEQAALAAL